jgi:hypothetical protein
VSAVAFCQADFYTSAAFSGKNYGRTRDWRDRRITDPAFQAKKPLI